MCKSHKKSQAERSTAISGEQENFIHRLVADSLKSRLVTISELAPSNERQFASLCYLKHGLEVSAEVEVRYERRADTCSVAIHAWPRDLRPLALLHGHLRVVDFVPMEMKLDADDGTLGSSLAQSAHVECPWTTMRASDVSFALSAAGVDDEDEAADQLDDQGSATDRLSWTDDGTIHVCLDLGESGPSAAVVTVEYVKEDDCPYTFAKF